MDCSFGSVERVREVPTLDFCCLKSLREVKCGCDVGGMGKCMLSLLIVL